MRVIRKAELEGTPAPNENFDGLVAMSSIGRLTEPGGAALVTFQDGARNHWHTHDGGQLLHVISGDCRLQLEGGPVETLHAGDFAIIDPGEKHWHGAAPGTDMAHLSVAGGEVRWLEPVED